MSRHSTIELQSMAREALAARDANDPRFGELVERLSMRFSITSSEVISHIEGLANAVANEDAAFVSDLLRAMNGWRFEL